jgi:uncharacterized protein (UPF0248 family)
MQPLRTLLDRIKWDAEFARGTFAIGYYDRVARKVLVVSLDSIEIAPGHTTFSFIDENQFRQSIPLHRVRIVYKNGVVIWQRPGSEA